MGNKTITKITNAIKTGGGIPENWTHGTIVYIYKTKEAQENVATTDQST